MLIENLQKESRNFRKQTAGEATYSVAVFGKEKIFQIQTYGSHERQAKGSVSQTVQFGREQAMALIDILQKEFDL